MFMKHLFMLVLVLAGWIAVPASAEEKEAMVVETNGGTNVVFFFDEKPEMTFSGENVEIKSTKESVLYPMNEVEQVKFEMRTVGIENTLADSDISFRFEGQLIVEGLNPTTPVAVYSLNGTQCLEGKADDNGKAVLPTETLSPGVYIVKANKISFKIIKK